MIAEVNKSETEDHLWKTEKGENLKEVKERSVKFLNSIREKHEKEKVVIISHAATIRCVLLGIIGHSAKNSYRIKQENCSINKLIWNTDEGWSIHSVNNNSHL